MPAMKLTFTAAMRARDVSRPRAEHLAAAEAAEARAAGQAGPAARPGGQGRRGQAGPAGGGTDKAKPSRVAAAMDERRGQAGLPRRRRGRPSR